MKDKVSIITATYNRVGVLQDCLNSVLKQTYPNKEHIIIDNLSEDGTEEILQNYMIEADHEIKYIREPDNGIYEAFNKGIKAATGSWVHFLSSDDVYYSKNSLSIALNGKIADYDLIANAIVKINSKEEIIIPKYIEHMRFHYFPHPGTIIKRNFLIKNGFYKENYKISSDTIFNCQYYPDSNYKINKTPLVKMSIEGVSHKFSFRHLWEQLKVFSLYRRDPFLTRLGEVIFLLKRYF